MSGFIPSFRLNLNRPVRPGMVALGRFDGTHPSLVFATSPDTLLIHSPHDSAAADSSSPSQLRTLALNRNITAIAAGALSSSLSATSCDQLLVGGDTSILCYDVENNRDLFFHELKDGVNALTVGRLSSSVMAPSLCLVGGSSAVTGLDMLGIESYWTAISDSVGALCCRQTSKDAYELIVGSSDCTIRIMSATATLAEIHEAAPVRHLIHLQHGLFAFALSNGTVGVYNNTTRLWMAKSKHTPAALAAFDLDGDGLNELVSGWSHGRLEVRHQETGELVYKDKFSAGLASVLVGDLRGEGKREIIACSVTGEIRGYAPLDPNRVAEAMGTADTGAKAAAAGSPATASLPAEVGALRAGLADDEMLDGKRKELYDKKNDLLDELRVYEAALKNSKNTKQPSTAAATAAATSAAVSSVSSPASTQLTLSLRPNKSTQSQLLSVQTNNDCVIKMLLVFADGLFGGNESRCVIPAREKQAGSISLTLRSDKNVSVDVRIKVVVGHRGSPHDHVFEFSQTLPRFSNFLYCKPRDMSLQQPKGSASFHTAERINRLVLWLNAAFYLDTNPSMSVPGGQSPSPLTLSVNSDSLLVSFLHLLSMTPLIIKMSPEHGGTVVIRTDSMELAGDLIQDFAAYCKIDQLDAVCDFPAEAARLDELMQAVAGHNDARMRMGGDMAEKTQQLKLAVVRAEDARLIGEAARTGKGYAQAWDANREMIAEYVKREGNQPSCSAT